jgi:glycine cleavage system aminomethyltransferase T
VRTATRRSPFADALAGLGGVVEPQGDWEVVASYGDEEAERAMLREAVAVADVTCRAKVDVRGRIEGALAAAGDAFVARVAADWALVLGAPGAEASIASRLETAARDDAMVTDATHLYGGFALAGPGLPELLARLTSWDPTSLAPGAATGAPIADVRVVLVRRDLEVPVLEAYAATELSRYVWETILDVVRSLGGGPVGWNALRSTGWR